jgi:hypothetical protein
VGFALAYGLKEVVFDAARKPQVSHKSLDEVASIGQCV